MSAEKIISKVYDYLDSAGNLVFQVVRFESKIFAQRRPYAKSFAWGLKGGWYEPRESHYYRIQECDDPDASPNIHAVWLEEVQTILYRLPELVDGIRTGQTIFICEGEKDVDNLTVLGFIATTCPMGAGKWKSTYTGTLARCHDAVVLADKDDPGRAHAQSVASELYSANISVKVVEMPDMDGTVIKDVSDWLAAGGTRKDFLNILEKCPDWMPTHGSKPTTVPEHQLLIDQYGEPYYLGKYGVIGINQAFWAGLHQTEHIELFEPDERSFYRYNQDDGLYRLISEDVIKQEVASRILEISRQQGLPSLETKRTNSTLNHVVAHLKGISERKGVFRKSNKIIHLANGVIVFKENGDSDLCEFSPHFHSRNQCPISYNDSAICDRFLNELLCPAVTPDDAVLLQKYAGLCLIGNNLIQRLLILDGLPARGKSTLALIIQSLVGQVNVTELRTRHLNDRFELYRYLKKTLLVGVDVQGKFLSEKGAHVIKGLIGGDWFDAEQKCGTGSFPFQGNFPILITSNSRLQVRLDGDTGAWKRRLLIIRFEGPAPLKKIPNFADTLIQEEGSGILNWVLQGMKMLLEDIAETGDIRRNSVQEGIVDALLAESDSLRHFLVENVEQNKNSDLSSHELVVAYAKYCPVKGWRPKSSMDLPGELENLMLELFGTARSNSIQRENKNAKGFRNVAFKDRSWG